MIVSKNLGCQTLNAEAPICSRMRDVVFALNPRIVEPSDFGRQRNSFGTAPVPSPNNRRIACIWSGMTSNSSSSGFGRICGVRSHLAVNDIPEENLMSEGRDGHEIHTSGC